MEEHSLLGGYGQRRRGCTYCQRRAVLVVGPSCQRRSTFGHLPCMCCSAMPSRLCCVGACWYALVAVVGRVHWLSRHAHRDMRRQRDAAFIEKKTLGRPLRRQARVSLVVQRGLAVGCPPRAAKDVVPSMRQRSPRQHRGKSLQPLGETSHVGSDTGARGAFQSVHSTSALRRLHLHHI